MRLVENVRRRVVIGAERWLGKAQILSSLLAILVCIKKPINLYNMLIYSLFIQIYGFSKFQIGINFFDPVNIHTLKPRILNLSN